MADEVPETEARRAWRIAGIGTLVLGVGLAVIAAAAGGSGRDGFRFFLLGALVSCALGALYAIATGVRDRLRGRAVHGRRIVAGAVLLILSLLLPTMLVGVGG